MNKKGFTLVEVLAVIVILSLIITIVSTNGFGAFGKAKEKIEKTNLDAIRQAGEVLMLEVKNCDNEYYGDLVTNFGATDCNELKEKAEKKTYGSDLIGCLNISLKYLLDKNYISGKGVEEIYNNNNNYKIKGCLDSNQKEISMIVPEEITPEIEKITDKLNVQNSGIFESIKDDIVEIKFVYDLAPDDSECNINKECKRKWKIDKKDLKNKKNQDIEVWIKDETGYGDYTLYIGSKGDIYNKKSNPTLFENFINLKNIEFKNFNTEDSNTMRGMFRNCTSLKTLNLENFNTMSVNNMSGMFQGTKSLIDLDLSNFDTTNVTIMSSMFKDTDSLNNITFGDNFNTRQVTKMESMFSGTKSLNELDLRNFDTRKVIDSEGIFDGMSNLKKIELNPSGYTDNIIERIPSTFTVDPSNNYLYIKS